jgi:cytidylate kinase
MGNSVIRDRADQLLGHRQLVGNVTISVDPRVEGRHVARHDRIVIGAMARAGHQEARFADPGHVGMRGPTTRAAANVRRTGVETLTSDEAGAVRKRMNEDDAVLHHRLTIAIDGPAAAGKSTVGEIVARKIDGVYFDTGLLYRAVTRAGIDRRVALDDGTALAAMTRSCDVQVRRPTVDDGRQSDVLIDGEDVTPRLRTPEIDRNVSVVAAHREVREVLLETQRKIGRSGRVVMVGRDIGTVVLPEAEVKIFLDASPEERAHRRHEQMGDAPDVPAYEQILADMRRRDEIDSQRDVAPLRPADDAIIIDSDPLTIEEVANRIVSIASNVIECQEADHP